MALIPFLVYMLSAIGVLGFICWDNAIEIPILYPFGKFEAEWWFHDKLKPGKPHLEQHVKDGPPLVAKTGEGGPIPWPYPAGFWGNTGTISATWDADRKMQEKYTPVNGMYGVTNQKRTDGKLSLEYYPNAANPNDYIAHRLLGPQADWTELESMGDRLKIYNINVFKHGTPFGAAVIGGPGKENDPRWETMPLYEAPSSAPGGPFMPPLTSTGVPGAHMAYPNTNIPRSINDYSGGEYNEGDPRMQGTNESNFVVAPRGRFVYDENIYGESLTGNPKNISAWAGESQNSRYYFMAGPAKNPDQAQHTYITTEAFYDPTYEGVYVKEPKTKQVYATFGWGTDVDSSAIQNNYNNPAKNNDPTKAKKDYIITQLTQENPIGTLEKKENSKVFSLEDQKK